MRGQGPVGALDGRRTHGGRGQTTLDFAIGISLFVIMVAFVLSFAPGMLDPFVDGPNDEPVVANRVADQLSRGMLGDPAEPYRLDSACTLAFFEEGNGDSGHSVPAECRYEDNDVAVRERVGIQTRGRSSYGLRVRILGDVDGDGTDNVLCHTGGSLTEQPDSCGTAYSVGETPPDRADSVSISRRSVHLPDDQGVAATLLVEVW